MNNTNSYTGKINPPLTRYQCEVMCEQIHDRGHAQCHGLEECKYLAKWIGATDKTMRIVEDSEKKLFYLEELDKNIPLEKHNIVHKIN